MQRASSDYVEALNSVTDSLPRANPKFKCTGSGLGVEYFHDQKLRAVVLSAPHKARARGTLWVVGPLRVLSALSPF